MIPRFRTLVLSVFALANLNLSYMILIVYLVETRRGCMSASSIRPAVHDIVIAQCMLLLIWNLCNWPIICDSVKNMTKNFGSYNFLTRLEQILRFSNHLQNQIWIFLDSHEAVEPVKKIRFLQERSEIANCCSVFLQVSRTNWTPLVVTKLFPSCKTRFIQIFLGS